MNISMTPVNVRSHQPKIRTAVRELSCFFPAFGKYYQPQKCLLIGSILGSVILYQTTSVASVDPVNFSEHEPIKALNYSGSEIRGQQDEVSSPAILTSESLQFEDLTAKGGFSTNRGVEGISAELMPGLQQQPSEGRTAKLPSPPRMEGERAGSGGGLPASNLAQVVTFPDIQGHWAQSFIEGLATRDVLRGFPDGTFRPDVPVSRAEYAAMVRRAFGPVAPGSGVSFVDVPVRHWAYDAITDAYQLGFLEGYPNNRFEPEQNIPRVQVLVSLANGLELTTPADPSTVLSSSFQDSEQVPLYARSSVAAATDHQLVVNYPDLNRLNPNQLSTRAQTAALIYQALANQGKVPQLSASDPATEYIVGYQPAEMAPEMQPEVATDPEVMREELKVPVPPAALLLPSLGAVAAPGSSAGTPTAFGASAGQGFVGASFQERTRYTTTSDGALSAGFGLGDPQKAVGFEVAVAVLDLKDEPLSRGSVSFKLHRLLPNDFAVAVGVENALIWGYTDSETSGYGVVSKVLRLQDDPRKPFSTLTMSLGLGSGRFKSEDNFNDGTGSVNVFGSVGVRVAEPVSLIADWTGQDLILGASIVPFRNLPLVITPAVADVTGSAGDGARFILGVGYSFPISF